MRHYFFSLLFVSIIHHLCAQELTATQKMPDSALPGGDYIVEVTISKSGPAGFMKFFQGVPLGCTAKEIESKGGSFTFDNGGAKIIWLTPPEESQFTISYQVFIPKEVAGTKNINGKIAYLVNKERKVYDLESKNIKIGDPLASPSTETILVSESDRTIVTSAPILKPKTEDLAPSKTVTDEPPIAKSTPAPTPASPVQAVKKEAPAPVAKKEEIKTAPVSLPVSSTIPVTAIPSSSGKTFRVQIGAFSAKPNLKGAAEVSTVVLDNGITKYFSGNFKTYEEAAKRKKEMIENGFPGAFVVSFENGKIVK